MLVASLPIVLVATINIRLKAEALGEIDEFVLKSCGPKYCYILKTKTAERGLLGNTFSFINPVIEVSDLKKVAKSRQISAADGYYDSQLDLIVLRDVKNQNFTDYALTISTGQEETF